MSDTQVSHHDVARHDPTSPLAVSPDYSDVSLHEHLKVGLREEESTLLARWSTSAYGGRCRYFELK